MSIHNALTTLIDRLDSPAIAGTDVISWGAPVPSFGDLSRSVVATLGLNPSNREFVDDHGNELSGLYRRFHTLGSLGLESWSDVTARHLQMILDSCRTYFLANPYDRWFKRLDLILAGAQASYYGASASACHLDLIPYATARKWTDLTPRQRSLLFGVAADSLALLLRESPVRMIILNGRSVVEQFQAVTDIRMDTHEMEQWDLDRREKPTVKGYGYVAWARAIRGVTLSQPVLILGYNHNIQSSFGVTTKAVTAIRNWVQQMASEALA